MGGVHILAAILVAIPTVLTAKACFPGNTWINCLLNTCTIYKNCPGDLTATCKIKRTECGCEANWFNPSGQKANCDVRKKQQICPSGQNAVECKVDLCKWPCNHPDFVNAPCRQTNCGQCMALYFVKEKWISCPNIVHRAAESEFLPIPFSQSDLEVCNPVPCNIKICIDQKCPLAPRAVCRPDGCNECKPAWYVGTMRVQCHAGGGPIVTSKNSALIDPSACANGEMHVPCDRSICDKQICRNYPNAVCSPDGCGKCKPSWHVDGNFVDCLSDECPPKVPFVKCIDDPCKYFSHYCPLAVCRASQCGKCEAKFFSNGVEVDCTMPPKKCPATVKPLNCKWFTCPSNMCPSNKRLMCRIDPCGRACRHDWVDVYNGEVMTCRIFDGDGRTIKDRKPEKVFMKDPLAHFFESKDTKKYIGPEDSNMVRSNTFPEPQHPVSVITGNARHQNQNRPEIQTKADVIVSRGPGRFRVEPIFVQPRQILSKADLFAMLNAFEHELMGISSLSIQNALRTEELAQMPPSRPFFTPNRNNIARLPPQQKVSLPKSQAIKPIRPSDQSQTLIGQVVQSLPTFGPVYHVPQIKPVTVPRIQTKSVMKPRFQFQTKQAAMPISSPISFKEAQFMNEKSDRSENIIPKLTTAEIAPPVKADNIIANQKHAVPEIQTKQTQGQMNTAPSQHSQPKPVWLLPVLNTPVQEQPVSELTWSEPLGHTNIKPSGAPSPIWLLPQGEGTDLGQKGTLGVMNEILETAGTENKQSDTPGKPGITPLGTPSLILQPQEAPDQGQPGLLQLNDPTVQKDKLPIGAIAPKIQIKAASKAVQNPQALGPKEDKGVPISLHMFQQWGA